MIIDICLKEALRFIALYNGRVERFNGRVSEIVKTTHFGLAKEWRETMMNYLKIYNHPIPQRNIGHLTPIQTLKEW